MKHTPYCISIFLLSAALFSSCSGKQGTSDSTQSTSAGTEAVIDTKAHSDSKGVGKFSSVTLGALDPAMAEKGKTVFTTKCSACHKTTDVKLVGPGLQGVTQRRTAEWIMNMITNPQEMTKSDPVAKKLFEEHLTQMTFQNVSDDDARLILEYLRQNDGVK